MKVFESLKLRWVTWVWNHTPNCAEMARLTSLSLERPLPPLTRLKMRLHHFICAWCRRYEKHLRFLHRMTPRLHDRAGELPGHGLPPEARQRIIQNLRSACKG